MTLRFDVVLRPTVTAWAASRLLLAYWHPSGWYVLPAWVAAAQLAGLALAVGVDAMRARARTPLTARVAGRAEPDGGR
ncbi:MAG: hypothetical protein ACT4PG_07390 [Panacagrimonas sp.]